MGYYHDDHEQGDDRAEMRVRACRWIRQLAVAVAMCILAPAQAQQQLPIPNPVMPANAQQQLPIPDPVMPGRVRQQLPIPDPVTPARAQQQLPTQDPIVPSRPRQQSPIPEPITPIRAQPRMPEPVAPRGQLPIPDPVDPRRESPSVATGAVAAVGPGDTLLITVVGQSNLETRVTVDADGEIVAPLLGSIRVGGQTPSAIGRQIAQGLRSKGLLNDPQVSVEVITVRSRVVSVLGQVARPGRYAIENNLSLLEVVAMAGGTLPDASDTAVLMRRGDGGQQRVEMFVGNRQSPSRMVQDTELQPGDVVFLPQAPRFYIYGEVRSPGAYPVEHGLTVMRALSLAGGLTERASESRIDLNRTDVVTGDITKQRVKLGDKVQPGDVIHVDERLF